MEKPTEQERRCQYYCEAMREIDPTDEDFERGQKFVDALVALKEAFNGVDTAHGDFLTSLEKGGVIVVQPTSPVERTVVKSQPFYEYLSPNERTESDAQLVIKWFQLLRPRNDVDSDGIMIEAHSPDYPINAGGMPIEEVYKFDITRHKVAICLI